jgi:hypothetical protein
MTEGATREGQPNADPLAVDDAVLAALEGKAIAGYSPRNDRPAYRGDLHRAAIRSGETARVLAKPFVVDGRTWIDRADQQQQEARVLMVTTPEHLPVEQLRTAAKLPHRSDFQ